MRSRVGPETRFAAVTATPPDSRCCAARRLHRCCGGAGQAFAAAAHDSQAVLRTIDGLLPEHAPLTDGR